MSEKDIGLSIRKKKPHKLQRLATNRSRKRRTDRSLPENDDIRLVAPSKREHTYGAKTFAPSDKADQAGFDSDSNN